MTEGAEGEKQRWIQAAVFNIIKLHYLVMDGGDSLSDTEPMIFVDMLMNANLL